MITVDHASAVPPFEQIRLQIAALIRGGSLEADTRLPSIRQLAGDLRVAPGTVARAYTELEQAGMIDTSRSKGTRVRAGNVVADSLRASAERFVAALDSGAERPAELTDVLGAVRAAWERLHA